MEDLALSLDWKTFANIILMIITAVMILLFVRPLRESEKALRGGVGLFVITIITSVLGMTEISNFFAVSSFAVIAIALIRIFWDQKIQ